MPVWSAVASSHRFLSCAWRSSRDEKRQLGRCRTPKLAYWRLMLPPLEDDPRFAAALRHFENCDWMEASDAFEELFFDAVRDEVPLIRFLLQISTGMHHISRGQRRAAKERIEEGLRVLSEVTNARGVDVTRLAEAAREAVARMDS